MSQKYNQQIAGKLSLSVKQVNNIRQMQHEGATIPFMSRYRKEATGNLDEVVIGNVVEQIGYFEELEKRKETVLKTIEAAGKLTPALQQRIDASLERLMKASVEAVPPSALQTYSDASPHWFPSQIAGREP